MKDGLRNIIRLGHLCLGLASGIIIFIVCLTGSIYTFRSQIENAVNYKKVYVENQQSPFISLDSVVSELEDKGLVVSQIIHYGKANRSIEILYSSNDGKASGTYFINPYSGEILGDRNTFLSPFFELILSLHKSLLMSNLGKQLVGAAILIFVLMLFSGIVLWIPEKLKNLLRSLRISRSKGKSAKLIDLHKVPGIYSLNLLLLIAIMGLYISYPWVKSTIIVSFGGNPVLSKANDEQKEKIKDDLAGSFAESLQKIIANNKSTSDSQTSISIENIITSTDNILPYQGIVTITLPSQENSWIKIKKVNRENSLRALLPDELQFNKSGKLSQKILFADKSPDQKLVAISLPLHTGEILGWPSLILYFIVSLFGASLPVTGTLMWYRRKKAQFAFRKGTKRTKPNISINSKISTTDWLIGYATKSGNSKLVALKLQEQLTKIGIDVRCLNASQIQLDQLTRTKYLFIVISTDGDGVPPPSAKKLYKQLKGDTNKTLDKLNYSICALGDTAYEAYCQAGKDLESLLKQNGAKELTKRTDCDADFARPSSQWITNTITVVLEHNGVDISADPEIETPHIEEKGHDEIRVSEVLKISNGESKKPCYHIVLQSKKELNSIKPGDSIEIYPKNPEWLVAEVCQLNNFKAKETIYQLTNEYEITSVTKTTMERYQSFAKNEKIEELLLRKKELKKYIAKANFSDLLIDFPTSLNDENLKDILPKKKGRLYSVASSTALNPKEIHLTVKAIRYNFKSRLHEGAGSVELTSNLKTNDKIKFKHYPNLEFRLPESSNKPIILIGVGTGIAPFRAFLQDNSANKNCRDIWLIWGDKKREGDFLYKEELIGFESSGVLQKMDLTFSRDSTPKVYVQNLIEQNETDFLKWINNDAHVYVCGSLCMAEDVKSVVKQILNKGNDSNNVFDDFIENQRYHEDAY